MTLSISSCGTMPAATITAAGERCRRTRTTPITPTMNPRTETIQHELPKDPVESTTPPNTTVPTTNSTFLNPLTDRPTDICHPSRRALPGSAAFSWEAGSC